MPCPRWRSDRSSGNPAGGALSDRWGARQALIGGLVIAAVGSSALAFVHTAREAFTAAGILGFGAAVIWPSQDALLAVLVDPADRSPCSLFATPP